MDSDRPLVPARMLNEVVYCPRLAVLEWVQGEFAPNEHTEQGLRVHRRVDTPRRSGLAAGGDASSEETRPATGGSEASPEDGTDTCPQDDELRVLRSLHLNDEDLGLTAVVDLCEVEDGRAVPVDYKKGGSPPGEPWQADQVQLGAQALLLRAHGLACEEAVVYYAESKDRVRLPIDAALEARVLAARDELLGWLERGETPPPLEDDARCMGCSLAGICLPDETRAMRGEIDPESARRLVPARPETVPLHVQASGARISKKEDTLEVWTREEGTQRVRMLELESVNLHGAVQVTAQALQALLRAEIPVCHFSYGGWFHGITRSLGTTGVELRRAQYVAAADPQRALTAAKAFVRGKIRNHRTLLRRNLKPADPAALRDLSLLLHRVDTATSPETLLGLEGTAARLWFQRLPHLLKPPAGAFAEPLFEQRNRRPPRDPVNALLSYGYGVLVKECTVALERAGLDARLGFYHRPRGGRPALALDLMEEFRPLVVDSTVLGLINRGEISSRDFLRSGEAQALTPSGRKTLLAAYERRMDTLVAHPIFGYSISYRRIVDVQARLLGRWLIGEIPAYRAFVTR
jgi:CRISP-associated protein Cas1